MELNVQDWKEFVVGHIFRIEPTKGVISDDLVEGSDIPYIGAKHDTNGYMMMCRRKGYEDWISKGNCIVFIQLGAGSAGYANYLPRDFIGMNGKTSCGYIDDVMTPYIGLFLETILCQERPKYNFGRSWTGERLKETRILLPIKRDTNYKPLVDKDRRYSDEGYIPDWQFMEDYIKSLHHKPITTKVKSGSIKELDIDNWEEFTVNKLFDIYTGGDLIMSELEVGSIPVASNSCENNNIAFYSSNINGRKLFNHQTSISIADRGCFYAFVQPKDFYIATRVKALVVKDKINIAIKQLCFMATIINQESFKFSYGRNCCANLPYIKIKLPIQRDNKGNPIIDNNNTYSDKGYIPDWQFMEDYINFLPYSDKI